MIARSIHPIPAPPIEEDAALNDQPSTINSAPRVRRVTNDPAREYAQRGGEVEPLPDSVAALILCRKGWAKIERHQIKISLDGEDLFFASRNSIVIAAKNGTGERVLWAVNRRAPELLHLLTDEGGYIESVPRKGEATWFSRDEDSQAAYGEAQAVIQRDVQRLRDLHASDTAEAARTARENAATTHRLVQSFPAEAGNGPEQMENGRGAAVFPKAERIGEAMRSGEAQRERAHVSAKQAARIGDAIFAAGAEDDFQPIPTEPTYDRTSIPDPFDV